MAFRYFHSFRDINANGDQVMIPLIKGYADIALWDINATYAINKRLSLTLELPVQYGTRTNKFEHDGVHIHTMEAAGVGDMRLTANYLILDPAKHPNQNIAFGLGIKVPTGADDVKDVSFRPTGPELRPVDPAIQPGDGGWGIIFSTNAFAKVYENTYAYASGLYLANPRGTNGVHTINFDVPQFTSGDPGLMVNSVPDQVLVRGGLTYAIWPSKGLDVSFGARWEGIPAHDLIGGSDGWRLPGFSVSVEPGISYAHGRELISVTTPVAVYRYGIVSVPLARTGSPLGGIASFADFQINISYSHLF